MKLGFVGLGKYGYAVMRAILRTGHHSQDDIFYESFDEATYSKMKAEVKENHDALEKYFERIDGDKGSRAKSIADLVKEVAGEEGSQGVLILSLNRERGTRVLKEINKHLASLNGTLWLFSSVSHLTIPNIRRLVSNGDGKLHVIRYLENMGTRKGRGIIAAYIEPANRQEDERVLRRVFYGLGKILIMEKEEDIDAARVIAGSTIGVVAYLADALAKAILAQKIKGLGDTPEQAAEIVYHSMAGALVLARAPNMSTWADVLQQISVLPGDSGEPGTTDALIEKTSKILKGETRTEDFFVLFKEAYSHILTTYRSNQGGGYEQ